MMRDNVWDMILKAALRIPVLIFEMKTEKKFPTSKNISNSIRRKKRRKRGRSKRIRRRRIKKRGKMRRKR
jgi:hypothetical protein